MLNNHVLLASFGVLCHVACKIHPAKLVCLRIFSSIRHPSCWVKCCSWLILRFYLEVEFLSFVILHHFIFPPLLLFCAVQRSMSMTSPLRSPALQEVLNLQRLWQWETIPTVCASFHMRWACTRWVWSTAGSMCQAAPSSSLWGLWEKEGPRKCRQEALGWRGRRSVYQVQESNKILTRFKIS